MYRLARHRINDGKHVKQVKDRVGNVWTWARRVMEKSGKSTSLMRTIRGQRVEDVTVVEQEVAKTGKSEVSRPRRG